MAINRAEPQTRIDFSPSIRSSHAIVRYIARASLPLIVMRRHPRNEDPAGGADIVEVGKDPRGAIIATRRTTSSKRDRERAKQARAAAKRERRAERSANDTDNGVSQIDETVDAAEVMQQLKELHDAYDAGSVDFDDFDAKKTELLGRLAAS